MKTLENDKKIAIFMGRTPQTDNISWFDENFKPLKYDDWNNLMPVYHKCIEVLDGIKEIDAILDQYLPIGSFISKENMYANLVRFIDYWNYPKDN